MPKYRVTVPALDFEIEAEPDNARNEAIYEICEYIEITPDPDEQSLKEMHEKHNENLNKNV